MPKPTSVKSEKSKKISDFPRVADVRRQIAAGVAYKAVERYLGTKRDYAEFREHIRGDNDMGRWQNIHFIRSEETEKELVRVILSMTVPEGRGDLISPENECWGPKGILSGGRLFLAYCSHEFADRHLPEGEDVGDQAMYAVDLELTELVNIDLIMSGWKHPLEGGSLEAARVDQFVEPVKMPENGPIPAESPREDPEADEPGEPDVDPDVRASARALRPDRRPYQLLEADSVIQVLPATMTIGAVIKDEIDDFRNAMSHFVDEPAKLKSFLADAPDRAIWRQDKRGSDRLVAVLLPNAMGGPCVVRLDGAEPDVTQFDLNGIIVGDRIPPVAPAKSKTKTGGKS